MCGISALAKSVSFSSKVVSMGSASACVHVSAAIAPNFAKSDGYTYFPRLQKAHSFQCLLNIWDLILQTRSAPLLVNFHELVLPT